MPDEDERIIAEDPFNRRLSGVRKGRPTSEVSKSIMGRKSAKPTVEQMLGGAQKGNIPIINEQQQDQEKSPLAPDVQAQLKELAQMPTQSKPKRKSAPPPPPNAPRNPLRPAVDGKPELLSLDPNSQGQGQPYMALGQEGLPVEMQASQMQPAPQQQIPQQAQQQAPPQAPAQQAQQQAPAQQQQEILSPSRAAQQDKIEKTYFYDDKIPTIFNFRHAMKTLEREVKRAVRHERPLSVCIVTFHELEMIKASYGELAVDEAFKNLGKVLNHYIDLDMEVAGRYNNQIVIGLPEFMAPNAAQLLDEIRRTLESSIIQFRQYRFSLVASIGVASYPTHGTSWKELLVKAEQASEQAIERGGNTIAFPPRVNRPS